MIADFKTKLDSQRSARKQALPTVRALQSDFFDAAATTNTPPGNPPAAASQRVTQAQQTHQTGPSASEILRGLTGAAPQQQAMPFPIPANSYPPPPPFAMPNYQAAQPVPYAAQPSLLPQMPPASDANPATAALRALEGMLPPGATQDPAQLQHWLSILQELQTRGVPPDQWPEVIRIMSEQQNAQQTAAKAAPTGSGRDRSRSPSNRRGSPVYEGYGGGYRQRSPLRNNSPPQSNGAANGSDRPKLIEYDSTLPQGHIKVYSRTLFIGGTTCGEAELRRIFSRFGEVQTCIAHPERRHAFIKMKTRAESKAARDGMEGSRDPEITSRVRSTRWGVGFGPRDCSDYTTGVSIIPIHRLTEADKKWTLTAEYGGTGGKPIESGMVLEEPDIEIGAGVSSKAISQRPGSFPKDQGPANRRNDRGSERRGGSRGGSGGRSDVNNIPVGSQQPQDQQQQFSMPGQPGSTFAMPQLPGFPAAPVQYDPSAFTGMPAVPGFGFNFMNAPHGS